MEARISLRITLWSIIYLVLIVTVLFTSVHYLQQHFSSTKNIPQYIIDYDNNQNVMNRKDSYSNSYNLFRILAILIAVILVYVIVRKTNSI